MGILKKLKESFGKDLRENNFQITSIASKRDALNVSLRTLVAVSVMSSGVFNHNAFASSDIGRDTALNASEASFVAHHLNEKYAPKAQVLNMNAVKKIMNGDNSVYFNPSANTLLYVFTESDGLDVSEADEMLFRGVMDFVSYGDEYEGSASYKSDVNYDGGSFKFNYIYLDKHDFDFKPGELNDFLRNTDMLRVYARRHTALHELMHALSDAPKFDNGMLDTVRDELAADIGATILLSNAESFTHKEFVVQMVEIAKFREMFSLHNFDAEHSTGKMLVSFGSAVLESKALFNSFSKMKLMEVVDFSNKLAEQVMSDLHGGDKFLASGRDIKLFRKETAPAQIARALDGNYKSPSDNTYFIASGLDVTYRTLIENIVDDYRKDGNFKSALSKNRDTINYFNDEISPALSYLDAYENYEVNSFRLLNLAIDNARKVFGDRKSSRSCEIRNEICP